MGNADQPSSFASPPCTLHEFEPVEGGGEFDATQWRDVSRWRKAERERLIAARLAIPADERAKMADRIATRLDALIGDPKGRIISLYWPFRGEPDLRPWLASITGRGATAALPVVIEKGRPLVFRTYRPGDRLEKGVWNIPIPVEGVEVIPDIVLAPVVGFDPQNYRLGYGGGFFDRTLAALPVKPFTIGVGYSMQAIPTIYPQPHDVPMDLIVTEL
jgi:5-formyltetrahydrofolate cyclo-ligase